MTIVRTLRLVQQVGLPLLLVLLSFVSVAEAQFGSERRGGTPTVPAGTLQSRTDSSRSQVKQSRPGFDLPDSLYATVDSTSKSDIDTIVRYTAKDSTVFDVARKRMTLVNNASIEFQNRRLDAHTIVMDFEANTLTAFSNDYDSVVNASLAVRRRIIRDTNRVHSRGAPVLHEGATPYEGEVIVYNFKTKRGTVQLGSTEMEGGFYYGEKIKQVAPATMFVENGRYTTCDAPVPHYYFESPKMKVVMQDKVFAEPVYLYVADVPIFALPFAVFPNRGGGRRSGIIPPNYQVTGDRGYGLTHLGYYQIFSDYFDAAVQTDLYTKGGYNASFRAQYNKRYLLDNPASIELGYGFTRLNSVDPFSKNWRLQGTLPTLHLGVNSTLSANLNFSSANYFENIAKDYQQRLTQQITSNASYFTTWEDLGLNLGVNYSRFQDLHLNTYTEESPSITLSKTAFYPFASASGQGNPTLSTLSIGYTLNAKRFLERGRNNSLPDNPDTTTFWNREQVGLLHSPSISISPKLGYFTVTPSFRYAEAWQFKQHPRNYYLNIHRDANGNLDTTLAFTESTKTGFFRSYDYSAALSVGTTLYGIANIGALGITAIRHTISPIVSIAYHPDFETTGPDVGISEFRDPRNPDQVIRYDLFTGELYHIGAGRKSANLTFGLGNDFEAKVEKQITADSVGEDRLKLLTVNASSAYDVLQKYISPLNLTAYSAIGTWLSANVSLGYSFYPRTFLGGDSTTATLLSLKQGLLRPLNASIGFTGSFSSSTTTAGENYDSLRRLVNVTTPEDERAMLLGGYYPGQFVSIPFRPKWNVSYGLSYQQRYEQSGIRRDFSANAGLELGLTQNMSISTSMSYDLVNGKILVPELRLHRDLHCWEANLAYRPPGSFISGFNFEIRIKAPQLQDIKLTRTENSYGEF